MANTLFVLQNIDTFNVCFSKTVKNTRLKFSDNIFFNIQYYSMFAKLLQFMVTTYFYLVLLFMLFLMFSNEIKHVNNDMPIPVYVVL